MKGAQSHELDVSLPANALWGLYSTLRLADLVVELLPDLIARIDVEEGDGGVGRSPGPGYYKEKFVKIDDEQRLKEVILVEGGVLDIDYRFYLFRFEVIEKTDSSCTLKLSIEYELDEEHEANATNYATTAPLAAMAEDVSKYLLEKKTDA